MYYDDRDSDILEEYYSDIDINWLILFTILLLLALIIIII